MKHRPLLRVAVGLLLCGATWVVNVHGQQLGQVAATQEVLKITDDLYVIHNEWSVPNVAFQNHLSIQLGGKRLELYRFGQAHTNGDVVVYFPAARTLAAGDVFVSDPKTPQLIDYAGGGSAKEWTRTLELSLQLDFDTVVPGHGKVATKEEMRKFREDTIVLRNRVHEMIVQKKTRDEIARMLQNEFHWEGVAGQVLMAQSFDGLIGELQ
jgi:glyoxylase-like metal-dependent hydrolase (beta-lactamase superfamily II)